MNFIEVKGGLGNQLFQYTFYRYCERVTGRKALLYTDFYRLTNSMENVTSRDLALDKYQTDYVAVRGNVICRQILYERDYDGMKPEEDGTFFSGYWQNKDFFEFVRSDIIREVKLKNEYVSDDLMNDANRIKKENSLSVHFRRGDYLNEANKKLFAELGLDYYRKAIAHIKDQVGEDLEIYIFTDDVEYARRAGEELSNKQWQIMPVRQAHEDLHLMSLTRHHIIANSSFSWWGAALASRDDGITIAPQKWFLDRPSPNLYLNGWKVI